MSTVNISNTTVHLCQEFHQGQVAIKLPADSASTKYGAINPLTGSLVTRDAQPWDADLAAVPDNLLPAFLQEGSEYHSSSQPMSQMIFKATFNASQDIVKVDIELLVDQVRVSRLIWQGGRRSSYVSMVLLGS
jgi:hypothetical protein